VRLALGAYLRARDAAQKPVKPRTPRAEDGTFVCAHDVLNGPALELLIKSIAGEVAGEVAAFGDVLQYARGLQRQRVNMMNHANVNANSLPADPSFKRTVAPPLHGFIFTALHNIDVNLGVLLDWKAFHVANGMLQRD
jgi:hypothetical protein